MPTHSALLMALSVHCCYCHLVVVGITHEGNSAHSANWRHHCLDRIEEVMPEFELPKQLGHLEKFGITIVTISANILNKLTKTRRRTLKTTQRGRRFGVSLCGMSRLHLTTLFFREIHAKLPRRLMELATN